MENIFNRDFFVSHSFEVLYSQNLQTGIAFKILFPDSRGTHLSCIENFCVKLNGKTVSDRNIRFCLNDKEFPIQSLGYLADEYWNLWDYAEIKIFLIDEILKNSNDCMRLDDEKYDILISYQYRVPFTGTNRECVREHVEGRHIFHID